MPWPVERRYERVQAVVPAELRLVTESFPRRMQTANLSLGGCYLEALCTVPPNTTLQVVLWLEGVKIRAWAEVVSDHPHLGNGLRFVRISDTDREELRSFIGRVQKTTRFPFNTARCREVRV